jgi:hypothetical protein
MGIALIVLVIVAILFLVGRYVDLPFGTPKSARLRYEERARRARHESEGDDDPRS